MERKRRKKKGGEREKRKKLEISKKMQGLLSILGKNMQRSKKGGFRMISLVLCVYLNFDVMFILIIIN